METLQTLRSGTDIRETLASGPRALLSVFNRDGSAFQYDNLREGSSSISNGRERLVDVAVGANRVVNRVTSITNAKEASASMQVGIDQLRSDAKALYHELTGSTLDVISEEQVTEVAAKPGVAPKDVATLRNIVKQLDVLISEQENAYGLITVESQRGVTETVSETVIDITGQSKFTITFTDEKKLVSTIVISDGAASTFFVYEADGEQLTLKDVFTQRRVSSATEVTKSKMLARHLLVTKLRTGVDRVQELDELEHVSLDVTTASIELPSELPLFLAVDEGTDLLDVDVATVEALSPEIESAIGRLEAIEGPLTSSQAQALDALHVLQEVVDAFLVFDAFEAVEANVTERVGAGLSIAFIDAEGTSRIAVTATHGRGNEPNAAFASVTFEISDASKTKFVLTFTRESDYDVVSLDVARDVTEDVDGAQEVIHEVESFRNDDTEVAQERGDRDESLDPVFELLGDERLETQLNDHLEGAQVVHVARYDRTGDRTEILQLLRQGEQGDVLLGEVTHQLGETTIKLFDVDVSLSAVDTESIWLARERDDGELKTKGGTFRTLDLDLEEFQGDLDQLNALQPGLASAVSQIVEYTNLAEDNPSVQRSRSYLTASGETVVASSIDERGVTHFTRTVSTIVGEMHYKYEQPPGGEAEPSAVN